MLSREARAALTLRMLGGFTTAEIARAFLVPEADHRAAHRSRETDAGGSARTVRSARRVRTGVASASVLEVIYLIFNEGYAATAGDDWMRPALCEEALRLGRILAELATLDSEVHGLVSLMEIQASRLRARVGPGGEPVLLLDQDRSRWDPLLIRRGLVALSRAEALGNARGGLGPYARRPPSRRVMRERARRPDRLAAHRRVVRRARTDRTVTDHRTESRGCRWMAFGPAAGLELVDPMTSEPSLAGYHLLPSVRGDLLEKLGRTDEARDEFSRAAELAGNTRERQLLLQARRPAAKIRVGPR